MIHTCNQRRWYVDEYLVPSMLKQGINKDDIYIYQDKDCVGNLKAFVESCKVPFIVDNIIDDDESIAGTWHLQDDVIICADFKKRTEELDNGIVCAYTSYYDENTTPGTYHPKDMWWSFPCIRIPNRIADNFHKWVDIYVWRDNQFGVYVRAKKYDDLIFKIFVENYYPKYEVTNLAPNLVDHVDYLLGGSLVNKQRADKMCRAIHFEQPQLADLLEMQLVRDGKLEMK